VDDVKRRERKNREKKNLTFSNGLEEIDDFDKETKNPQFFHRRKSKKFFPSHEERRKKRESFFIMPISEETYSFGKDLLRGSSSASPL